MVEVLAQPEGKMAEDPSKAELELLKSLKEDWKRTWQKHKHTFPAWLKLKGNARGGSVGYTERWKTGRKS